MKTVHLVLFMGQSNMAGRGEAEEAPGVSEEAGYEYRAVSDTEVSVSNRRTIWRCGK